MTTEIYTYLHPLSLHDALPICLPPLVVLPVRAVSGLEASLDLLFDEADQVRCGHRLLADRLFEVVLIQLLRWLFDHAEQARVTPGLIHALSDRDRKSTRLNSSH